MGSWINQPLNLSARLLGPEEPREEVEKLLRANIRHRVRLENSARHADARACRLMIRADHCEGGVGEWTSGSAVATMLRLMAVAWSHRATTLRTRAGLSFSSIYEDIVGAVTQLEVAQIDQVVFETGHTMHELPLPKRRRPAALFPQLDEADRGCRVLVGERGDHE